MLFNLASYLLAADEIDKENMTETKRSRMMNKKFSQLYNNELHPFFSKMNLPSLSISIHSCYLYFQSHILATTSKHFFSC